ncbi:ABC transporter permease [Mucilaginibacter myungsuensis]|uniref:ABC transporter permease n=1 Tax=Mucilaginibacter myungsuensis TaxID=649104 RepID=A0A929KTP3_9SPHI|nr:ABC transporter permease [Mucilaginibacter myungsuensis]MBE9660602.1 ABC transporter permease [Mucilaginibacter myungsuensis]MDN3600646.1 ABC transporter permease [Mucilaginibacter myungsuensis]
MIRNYIKIAWRNLYKHKAFSLIHVLGLTIGITVCMMIFLFIMNEFSVDKFHQKGDRIYRVMRRFDQNKTDVPYLSGPYAPALLNDYPQDIKMAVRVRPTNYLVSFDDKAFSEKKVYDVDPGFFELFSFPLIKGDTKQVLKNPNSVVLTEHTAKKYFGSIDAAMGKVIKLDKTLPLTVTGIAKNIPSNSHLDFDFVVPITNYTQSEGFNGWINNGLFVYALLDQNTDVARLQSHFGDFMEKYMGNDMRKFGMSFSISLRPLKDIYFEPSSAFDNVKHGDKTVVYIFISIAVLIMMIACINFTNLSTIRAVERSKEVGLRKVLGALKNHLILQFIGESLLLTIVSCILSVGLLLALMPYYNDLLGYSLTVSWNTAPIYLFLIGVILVVGFLAGSYPAFFLSAFSPIQALKGRLKLGKGGSLFRQGLVVVQFSVSVLLIIGTIVIVSQMNYVKSKQLGYDQSQSVVIPIDNNDIYDKRDIFKKQLTQNSNVASVSLMSGEPGGFFDVQGFEAEGQREIFKPRTEYADFEYVKTLGLKIIAGRDLSPQFATDSTQSVLINRTAATKLGFTPQQALGKWMRNAVRDSLKRRVVGVVEDFNFLSLKENMDALVISPSDDRRVIVVKLKPGSLDAGLNAVKDTYRNVAPVYPLEYTFLDQKFNITYKKDLRQQTILSIFSGLAIFVACLGLFGLASFTATKRTKEIGVRKVLGSSVPNILLLLSKDLLKPVLVATVIAMPLGYYCMDKWLQNFAYKIDLNWWVFALAGLVTAIIAFATISFQSVKAALANPVKSLRSE